MLMPVLILNNLIPAHIPCIVYLRSILILSSHLHSDFLSRLFGHSDSILYCFLIIKNATCLAHLTLFYNSINICRRVQIMNLLILKLSPFSCHIMPRSSQDPVRNHLSLCHSIFPTLNSM